MFKLHSLRTPFQLTQCLTRTIFVVSHQRAKASLSEESKNVSTEEKFQPIFRFPHMKILVLINRLKVYQTLATGLAVPITATLTNFNFMDMYTALSICGIGACACLPLYGLSYFCKDIVGFVYVNPDATKTKIAYLDYWGKRVDVVIDSSDIIPFSDQPVSFTDGLYVNLRRYSVQDKLKINLKLGEVLDYKKFSHIFSMPIY